MTTNSQTKTLIQILIGAAWIDGQVQPEERDYLQRVAMEKGWAEDAEIQALLHQSEPVTSTQCYSWLKEYLGDRPSSEQCQQLLEAISGLVYSDGTIATEEAKLLTDLQQFDPTHSPSEMAHPVLESIRSLYQRWMSTLNS
jgi:uncharacterized tellurite resistance protein B-like protein